MNDISKYHFTDRRVPKQVRRLLLPHYIRKTVRAEGHGLLLVPLSKQPEYAAMSAAGLMTAAAPFYIRNGLLAADAIAECVTWDHLPYARGDTFYLAEIWRCRSGCWHSLSVDIQYEDREILTLEFTDQGEDGDAETRYSAFIDKWGVSDVWHPSIGMPKLVARTFLTVSSVSVSRLRDIPNEKLSEAYGLSVEALETASPEGRDKLLKVYWKKRPRPEGETYEDNPWVFLVALDVLPAEEEL